MNTQLDVLSSVLPRIYYDADSSLVDILEDYYRWIDSESVDLTEIRSGIADEKFVELMLSEYAPGIEKTSQTNAQLLIKHATELFRAKGTPRAIDLFFRLVYQVNANVTFPRNHTFTPSSGVIANPRYLEVTSSKHVDKLNHQYALTSSGGVVFVEGIHRVNTRTLLLITDVSGSVKIGDSIFTTSETRRDASKIVGSLVGVANIESSEGFAIGQRVEITNNTGTKANGYVANVDQVGTRPVFRLEAGGVGITPFPEITISESIIDVEDVITTGGTVFEAGSTVTQTVYSGTFTEVSGKFDVGDSVDLEEYSGETLVGSVPATIIATEQVQGTGSKVYFQSNGAAANIAAANYIASNDSYGNNMTVASVNASATVVSTDSTANVVFSTNDRPYAIGDTVYQYANGLSGTGQITATPTANKFTVEIENGQFVSGVAIRNEANNTITTPADVEFAVGLKDVSNTLFATGSINCGNTTATVSNIYNGSVAAFTVKALEGQRTILVDAQTLDTSANEYYGNNYIDVDGNRLFAVPVGSVSQLQLSSSTNAFDRAPIVTVEQPTIPTNVYQLNVSTTEGFEQGELIVETGIEDNTYLLTVADASSFSKGDLIGHDTLASTVVAVVDFVNKPNGTIGVRSTGIWANGDEIKSVDGGGIFASTGQTVSSAILTDTLVTAQGKIVEKTPDYLIVATAESFTFGSTITGKNTGASQEIETILDVSASYPTIAKVKVNTSLASVNGRINAIVVQSTQPGFIDNEDVIITVDGNRIATGKSVIGTFGKLKSYFTTTGSQPSGGHALYDSDYYQHLSYEIKTAIDIDKYPNNKSFLQVAGMKMFVHNELEATAVSTPKINTAEVEVVDV